VWSQSGSNLAFFTNSSSALTEVMRLDSSGNLGLGITPSAWQSTFRALQVGSGTVLYNNSSSNGTFLGSNFYWNGSNNIYIASTTASAYGQVSGQHQWYTAPSGTAGNAITFTQAMTLDNSGRLLLGTTSAVGGSSTMMSVVQPNASYDAKLTVSAGAGTTSSYTAYINNYVATIGIENSSGGNLVGGSSPYAVILSNSGAYPIQFGTSNTVRATIDSSGNLLVGTTNTSPTAGIGNKITVDATAPYFATVGSSSSSGNAAYTLYSTGAGAYRFYVDYGGTVHATSIVITAISDERLKENIKDIDTGLSTIMALKPRRFDWKEGKGQNKKNAAGFIAQEFETVFPESIGLSKAGEDGIEYKNINHETLIPTLVKAIQEQQAIIEQLKAKVGI
jgi:hypothetical protein